MKLYMYICPKLILVLYGISIWPIYGPYTEFASGPYMDFYIWPIYGISVRVILNRP